MKRMIYSVYLTEVGNDPLSVIKTYRDLTCLGLKDVKDKIDSAPCILLETANREEAELYKTSLEECGATVTILSSAADHLS